MNDTPIMRIIDNDNEMYVKRDDLLPFSFGGNKVRIANIFINDMKISIKIVWLVMEILVLI